MNTKWIRVTRKIQCPICKHPDWCCIGEKYVNCMRVVSDKPCANGGYFHPINGHEVSITRHEPPPRATIDAEGMMKRWFSETSREQYDALASSLGLFAESLIPLKCAWSQDRNAWAFPMRDGSGMVVGIRLRTMAGHKFSVPGGREGVFLPKIEAKATAYIAEGPTDTAALMALGKFGIGRPNCSGGIAALSATVSRLGIQRCVIVADNDCDKTRPNGDLWNPGLDGAQRLAEEIEVPCCILILPCKDSREFLNFGGTSELLDSLTDSLVWHQPKRTRNITHSNNLTVPVHR